MRLRGSNELSIAQPRAGVTVAGIVEGVADDVCALVFDDGPSRWTPPILELLRARGARATFCVIGQSAQALPDVVRDAARAGHEIANHTYTHPLLTGRRTRLVERELARTAAVIEQLTGTRPRLFRPPYVAYDEKVLAASSRTGHVATIVAMPDPPDFEMDSPLEIAKGVVDLVRPGAVICLHDGRPPREPSGITWPTRGPTVTALTLALPRLRAFRFVTVSELLGAAEPR
jgi:peptidoglycan/xylan/chitin deacetylase (PgdA/CDA1 family)